MLRLLKTICLLLLPLVFYAQHPVTFFTVKEAAKVKKNLYAYPLLSRSFADIKKITDPWLGKEVDVPWPKDPAGGYTHDKHKANYTLMFNCGVLYNLTGDQRYATLVRNVLLKYADLNPQLKNHPQATSSSPGHIFWQALNDANWMVYAGMAYDLVYNTLSSADRKKIEEGAFKPEVDFFTGELKDWFNLLHNHAVWACAGVGIIGIATHNKEYIDMALYGTAKDGKRGFIAQMDNLFSPDGYYTEGPYYTRYAILPYTLFANALNNYDPSLKIFEHRDRILLKAVQTCLQQTNTDGAFFPLNDALKEKDFTTNELVTALSIFSKAYGVSKDWLPVVKRQGRVMLNEGGLSIATTMKATRSVPDYFPYKTIESTDGVNGNEGGLSVLRIGKNADLTSLLFKYTSHGLSHGHFDKLNINLFDKGNEILADYGSVRFIGVEQKYGGRYLPENKTYAEQTIAHNTVVVDETSQFNGEEKTAEHFHSDKLFSSTSNPSLLVVAAKEDNAYKGVDLRRTVFLLQLPGERRMLVDFFNIRSDENHQYDLPFQYNGQVISTSFAYDPFTKKQETLGKKNGYQFLWKEAQASVKDTTVTFTFLNKHTYYTISSLINDSAKLFFTRSGANDPKFNLRHEPAFIIRKNGTDQQFINVVEIHGDFDPIAEFSTNAYPAVKRITMELNNDQFTVAAIDIAGKKLVVATCKDDFDKMKAHSAAGITWTGPYVVIYDGKKLSN